MTPRTLTVTPIGSYPRPVQADAIERVEAVGEGTRIVFVGGASLVVSEAIERVEAALAAGRKHDDR